MHRAVNDVLRRLTYNERLVWLARTLHLAGILKRSEYWLRGPSDGLVHHAIAGVEFVLAAPDAAEFRTVERCYHDEMDFVQALEKKLRPGSVYYDVGSNAGQFLIPAAKITGEGGLAVGFEPEPENYQRLMRNVELNHLKNIKVFQMALGDRNGEIQIYGSRETATTMPRAAAWQRSSQVAAIQAMRGDGVRANSGLPIPNAFKIDVEGAEFGVLCGLSDTLSSPRCELLCLEIHPRFLPPDVSIEMVLSLARSFGFNQVQAHPRRFEIHVIAGKKAA